MAGGTGDADLGQLFITRLRDGLSRLVASGGDDRLILLSASRMTGAGLVRTWPDGTALHTAVPDSRRSGELPGELRQPLPLPNANGTVCFHGAPPEPMLGDPSEVLRCVADAIAAWEKLQGNPVQERESLAADAALVDAVLSASAESTDRSRALRRLGLRSDQPVRVVAAIHETGGDARTALSALVRGLAGARSGVTTVGRVAAALVQLPLVPAAGKTTFATLIRARLDTLVREQPSFAGLRIGIGGSRPATDALTSWREAHGALRFAGAPGLEPVADTDELGVLMLFAERDAATLAALPDIAALNRYQQTLTGRQDVAVLDAFCRTGSLRRAAAELHMHHSSLTPRLERIEALMGWDLSVSRQRLKARMTILVSRLATSEPDGLPADR